MTARFGEILRKRRQELHYDIRTVSNVIKIRPQILEMFENGDLENIPPRGYAKGMIATYARYLNLDPRLVIDAYMDDLVEYEQNKGHAGNYAGAVLDISSRPGTPGGYDTSSRPLQLSSSRPARPMQQAGYVTDATSHHMGMSAQEMRDASGPSRSYGPKPGPYTQRFGASAQRNQYDQNRFDQPYGGREPYSTDQRTRQMPRDSRMGQQPGRRPDMPTRQMPPYAGDPRANMRENRMPDQGRPTSAPRSSRVPHTSSKSSSPLNQLMSNPKLMMIAAGLVLLLVFGIGFMGYKSYKALTAEPEEPPVAEQTDEPSTDDSQTTDSGAATDDDADADNDENAAAPTEARIKITVKDGMSTWLEVKNGGKTIHANTVTGPLEFEWVVSDTMEITVGDADAVTITNNGEAVAFDTKTSGVNRVTIKEPEPAVDDSADTDVDTDAALASSDDSSDDTASSESTTGR